MSYENQHVVSKALIYRFAEDHKVGVFSMDNLTYTEDMHPQRLGVIENLIDQQYAEKFERKWGQVEAMMPHVFKLIENSTLLKEPKFTKTVLDFVALHFARGHTLHQMYLRMLPVKRQQFVADILESVSPGQIVYELTGILLPTATAASVAPQLLANKFDERAKQTNLIGESLLNMFKRGSALAANSELEIWYSKKGDDFLLGDMPAVSYNRETDQVGVLGGVAWNDANTIVMPLGPNHTAALSKNAGYFEADERMVMAVNKLQIRGSLKEVYYRPGSGLGARLQREMPLQQAK